MFKTMSKTKATSSGSKGGTNVGQPIGTIMKRFVAHIILMLYSVANNGKFSGRADGNVYMRNGRTRGMRVPRLVRNVNTSRARGLLASFSSMWRTLTPTEQNSWLNYSITKFDRFANAINVTGLQAFLASNVNLSNVGVGGALTTAPSKVEIPSVNLSKVNSTVSTVSIVFDIVLSGIGLIYATAPQSAGVSRPSKSAYRLIGIGDFTSASPLDIFAIYSNKFGAPVAGSKIFIQVVNISDVTGQSSAPTNVDGITS